MATIRVQPLPDGVSMRGNWQVKKSGGRVSTHVKKSAAKRRARQEASDGDTLYIHGVGGQVLDERTVGSPGPAGMG